MEEAAEMAETGRRRRRARGCGAGERRLAAETRRRRGALGRALASRTPGPDGLPLGKISAPL